MASDKKLANLTHKGRQKGHHRPKEIRELRERIKEWTGENFDSFRKYWEKVGDKDPSTACKIYLDMLRYSLPVLSSVNMEVENTVNSTITETLIALRDGVVGSKVLPPNAEDTEDFDVEENNDIALVVQTKVEDVSEENVLKEDTTE